MPVTRRTFLHGAIAAGFTFAVASNGNPVFGQKNRDDFFPVPVEVYSQPLYSVTARDFEQLIGQTFSATSPGGQTRSLVLIEVSPSERLGNSIRGTYGEGFSLIFESAGKQRSQLPQDVYTLTGNGFDVDILVVPVGREMKQYEVVINRLTR